MSKISITFGNPSRKESYQNLLESTHGAAEALEALNATPIGTDSIEVILISLTNWMPYEQIWIKMVLVTNGKKDEKTIIINKTTNNLRLEVNTWIKETLREYLAKKLEGMQKDTSIQVDKMTYFVALLPSSPAEA